VAADTAADTAPHDAVIYEVNVEVDVAIADAYRMWLREHVTEMVALPGFLDATRYDVLEPNARDGTVAICVHYRLRDRAALDAYLRDHAPRMRADGVARFGDRLRATRRVLVKSS
jgi:hypothetical protein